MLGQLPSECQLSLIPHPTSLPTNIPRQHDLVHGFGKQFVGYGRTKLLPLECQLSLIPPLTCQRTTVPTTKEIKQPLKSDDGDNADDNADDNDLYNSSTSLTTTTTISCITTSENHHAHNSGDQATPEI